MEPVDIIIVSYNTRALLQKCLASIDQCCKNVEGVRTIVVDNGSNDGSPAMVATSFPLVTLVALNENIGFGAANNRGIDAGEAPYLLFLNSDAELTQGAIEGLTSYLESHPDCAMVGPKLLNPDGSFQRSCRRFSSLSRNIWCLTGMEARFPRHFHSLRNWLSPQEHKPHIVVDMVSGACFLARRAYLDSIGNFDENLFLYEEETDISLPAKQRGLEVAYCPEAEVIHHGGASVVATELSDFAARHLFRSKYCSFRKHRGAIVAWLAYCSDCLIFGLSTALNAVRRSPSPASRTLRACRRAWRESFIPIAQLRHAPDFYTD